MQTTFIYALCEPGTMNIRYIGKSNRPKIRLSGHFLEMRQYPHLRKSRWLQSLSIRQEKPSVEILDEVPIKFWSDYEKQHIQMAKNAGFDLTNLTEGGDSGPSLPGNTNPFFGKRHSQESRKKMSVSHSGANHPNFGKKLSQETRDKISKSHIGVRHTPEVLARILSKLRGRPAWNKGLITGPQSEESRRKKSLAVAGEKHPNFGKPRSSEVCVKISETLKRRNRGLS
jgi:NUMOD3 motif-containing protein